MKGDFMLVWLFLIAAVYYAALVLWYKFRSKWLGKEEEHIYPKVQKNEDIMGKSNYQKRKETQEVARPYTEVADIEKSNESESIFVPEAKTIEETDMQMSPIIPVERLDEIFGEMPELPEQEVEENEELISEEEIDWDAEEAELQQYRVPAGDEMYATGITFEELGRLGTILQKEEIEKEEIAEAGEALQKIAGTDLLDVFISALPDALDRISNQIEEQLKESQSQQEKIPAWMCFDIKNYT